MVTHEFSFFETIFCSNCYIFEASNKTHGDADTMNGSIVTNLSCV